MKKKNVIEFLCQSGMIWLILGSLISADSCTSLENCKRNLRVSDELIQDLEDANISQEEKEEIKKCIEKGKVIIQQELDEYEKNKKD